MDEGDGKDQREKKKARQDKQERKKESKTPAKKRAKKDNDKTPKRNRTTCSSAIFNLGHARDKFGNWEQPYKLLRSIYCKGCSGGQSCTQNWQDRPEEFEKWKTVAGNVFKIEYATPHNKGFLQLQSSLRS